MIIIFDLDDTLYEEMTFVKEGFKAVSIFLKDYLEDKPELIYDELIKIHEREGRGKIFDHLLEKRNKLKKNIIAKCISIYRYHKPKIKLNDDALCFLKKNKGRPLYLVTDGNKNVQANKVEALNLKRWFSKIFITHRYGIKSAKPSLYCFEKIKDKEKCNWKDLVYIGDNPSKDFVSLKKVEAKTIRVLTGNYSTKLVSEEYDADLKINSLSELESSLGKIFN